MNASSVLLVSSAALRHRPRQRAAFALVVTLLILSLLVVVAVSYLTSMVNERQTADAYTSKTRAEQVAQAGVESAEAILAQSFRDFPDSVTAWDPQQSANSDGSTNEGTTLYLRAVGTTASLPATTAGGSPTSATVADPRASNTTPAANDAAGNDPNNPLCKNFVLPLISGVPGGRARLMSEKLPTGAGGTGMLPPMSVAVTDPTQQNYTDLNVRRFANDLQGVIGSPPNWASGAASPSGPKPARALWVNLKDSAGRLTGRYAFWIEDESFRANVNTLSNAAPRIDNTTQPTDNGTPPVARSLAPSDMSLPGTLAGFPTVFDPAGNSQSVLDTRNAYPAGFLPEPLAFKHPANGAPPATAVIDGLRYLTTTQSGALNLTRHGTERLNLNTTVTTPDLSNGPGATQQIQHEVDQLVKTLQFHLPNLGQRFYRTAVDQTNTTLNAIQVKASATGGDPAASAVGDPNVVYDYKVAANLRDFLDKDSQPTVVLNGGSVASVPPPASIGFPQPFGTDGANVVWAQGKEAAPFLQETVVRFRPVNTAGSKRYSLKVDYYLEFWNMSDKDVYAVPQTDATKPHLNSAVVGITNQQTWVDLNSGSNLTVDPGTGPPPVNMLSDYAVNLNSGVFKSVNGSLVAQPNGVVFAAGKATVITTDPDFASYVYKAYGNSYNSYTGVSNLDTTFYCSNIGSGRRAYAGPLADGTKGIEPVLRDVGGSQDYDTEISMYNAYGYIDCCQSSIAEGGSAIFTNTDKFVGVGGSFNDYGYGGSLYGNSIYSQMGDPRTNNEQMVYHRTSGATGDQSRYYNGNHTLGYHDGNYVQPVGGTITPPPPTTPGVTPPSANTFIAWPDYYNWDNNTTAYNNPDFTSAPAVVADGSLTSIGQLGDVYDPARLVNVAGNSTPQVSRGGGRTFKIGQRDDRFTYDSSTNPTPGYNNTVDDVSASTGWASWRLADVFSVDTPIELPGRINVNGILRDGGAAFRAALTGLNFQPVTTATGDANIHGARNLAGTSLNTDPTIQFGLTRIIAQMEGRLKAPTTHSATSNTPFGPFFERGEFGELENSLDANGNATTGTPIFGKNVSSSYLKSPELVSGQDLNRTFDHGREEVFRRLAELICTRGDTFTVYAVGQSLIQPGTQDPTTAPVKITGTHRLRVTFRLVPKQVVGTTAIDFHPGYTLNTDGTSKVFDFNPTSEVNARFPKPDRYDAQILEVNTL